jgi:hypothetical protein
MRAWGARPRLFPRSPAANLPAPADAWSQPLDGGPGALVNGVPELFAVGVPGFFSAPP